MFNFVSSARMVACCGLVLALIVGKICFTILLLHGVHVGEGFGLLMGATLTALVWIIHNDPPNGPRPPSSSA